MDVHEGIQAGSDVAVVGTGYVGSVVPPVEIANTLLGAGVVVSAQDPLVSRNLLDPAAVAAAGLSYQGIGLYVRTPASLTV